MTRKKGVAIAGAVLLAGFICAKVYASVNPSCPSGWAKVAAASGPSPTLCIGPVGALTFEIKAR